jgi:hypothetical protein
MGRVSIYNVVYKPCKTVVFYQAVYVHVEVFSVCLTEVLLAVSRLHNFGSSSFFPVGGQEMKVQAHFLGSWNESLPKNPVC